MILNEWVFVGLFFLLGPVLLVVPIALSKWLAPKRPTPIKQDAYECGAEPVGLAWKQFRAEYYIFALVFLVFDVELVFMFPWALAYNKLGLFALFEMVIFVLLLVVALVYTWRKGALEWS